MKFKDQTVAIKATHILFHSAALLVVSLAILILQIMGIGKTETIIEGNREIQERIAPLCLTAGALDACRKQIGAASQPAVVRLCKIVLTNLDQPVQACNISEFGGNDNTSAADKKQERQSRVEGGEGDAVGSAEDPTAPSEGPAVAEQPPAEAPPPVEQPPESPEEQPPVEQPPEEEPPVEQPVTDDGTCVGAICVNIPGDLDETLPDQIPGDLVPTPPL